jgi:hypothetical protein
MKDRGTLPLWHLSQTASRVMLMTDAVDKVGGATGLVALAAARLR